MIWKFSPMHDKSSFVKIRSVVMEIKGWVVITQPLGDFEQPRLETSVFTFGIKSGRKRCPIYIQLYHFSKIRETHNQKGNYTKSIPPTFNHLKQSLVGCWRRPAGLFLESRWYIFLPTPHYPLRELYQNYTIKTRETNRCVVFPERGNGVSREEKGMV
jgi:hypothetical protein